MPPQPQEWRERRKREKCSTPLWNEVWIAISFISLGSCHWRITSKRKSSTNFEKAIQISSKCAHSEWDDWFELQTISLTCLVRGFHLWQILILHLTKSKQTKESTTDFETIQACAFKNKMICWFEFAGLLWSLKSLRPKQDSDSTPRRLLYLYLQIATWKLPKFQLKFGILSLKQQRLLSTIANW